MAELKSVAVVPLNGANYPTWKIQCRMALMKEGLWGLVNGTEDSPTRDAGAEKLAKFAARKDKALATIVLAVETKLLYLIGDPDDPQVVWKKLADQYQRKTWANKLELRRKLFSTRLAEGGSLQEHIKAMTEVLDELSVVDEPVKEEDRVVYLLASLPDEYSVLVTALEANADVPKLEVVTERLFHEEKKLRSRSAQPNEMSTGDEEALVTKYGRGPRCHFCRKFGHIKRYCTEFAKSKERKEGRRGAYGAVVNQEDDSDSEGIGLLARHALAASSQSGRNRWIVDSGATSHMCNSRQLFEKFQALDQQLEVTLGDGHSLKALGRGMVKLSMNMPDAKEKQCVLHDVLWVPELAFNLLSVSKATEAGKTTEFTKESCRIRDVKGNLIAVGSKVGSLYYLDHGSTPHQAVLAEGHTLQTLWHRRFGHLGNQGLAQLAEREMVDGLDLNQGEEASFCEPCAEGKHHRSPFPISMSRQSKRALELIHSDVCGKIGTPSLSGAQYFLTFIDDYTHYTWMYVLKRKDQVFEYFCKWKALVERSTGLKVKTLRTDNGGEYTSQKFRTLLSESGIRHELTVPKTPEQNGVAERMNRTLVEAVRSMLADSGLPRRFWAEALSTAVYLRNRSPTKSLQHITPVEAWTGEKPDVSHLRVFGCTAYAHVPKDERRKFDPKARKCVLLGYGIQTKGYRLYDLTRRRVLHSRDVIFNELEVGAQKENSNQEQEKDIKIALGGGSDHEEDETIDESPDAEQTPLRRSDRNRRTPDWFGDRVVCLATDSESEPSNFKDAMMSPEAGEWKKAMQREMSSLHSNKVWDLVKPPPGRKVIGSRWVYKRKHDPDGVVTQYKARLVAQGFSQKFGWDYEETFSPVVRGESVRMIIATATQHSLELHQMDVTTAFLNGELEEEVYMRQPEGFVASGDENLVCKLRRSLYGLKQSPRCWNHALDEQLRGMGFKQTSSDPCVYVSAKGDMYIIAVYVDDLVVAGEKEDEIARIKRELSSRFEMKDLGKMHYFLGVKVIQDPDMKQVWIGQPLYTERLLQKFQMQESKPVSTPVNPGVKLVKKTEQCESFDQKTYQAAVGSLLYLSTKTRPDISFAVGSVARFCADPTKQHWMAVKRIMRYLNGTVDLGLLYGKCASDSCVGFSDADWAGSLDDRKSTSGYLFQCSGAAVSWRSCKQSCVALSTAEAEYVALAAAAQEAVWLQQLICELLSRSPKEIEIREDNQSAICLAKNPQCHGKTKHVDIKYHFVRDQVECGKIKLVYCQSEKMTADILTKGLPVSQFVKLRQSAGVAEFTLRN